MTDLENAIGRIEEAFQDCIDNYITVIANDQQTPIEEIKADPVVKGWYEALTLCKGIRDAEQLAIGRKLMHKRKEALKEMDDG